jgi:hypothetical protein
MQLTQPITINKSIMRTSLRGTRGNSFIIEWCQITIRGRWRIKQHTFSRFMRTMYAVTAHVTKNFSSVHKSIMNHQRSDVVNVNRDLGDETQQWS